MTSASKTNGNKVGQVPLPAISSAQSKKALQAECRCRLDKVAEIAGIERYPYTVEKSVLTREWDTPISYLSSAAEGGGDKAIAEDTDVWRAIRRAGVAIARLQRLEGLSSKSTMLTFGLEEIDVLQPDLQRRDMARDAHPAGIEALLR